MITGRHTSFVLDKRMGDIGEHYILPKIQNFFDSSIQKTTGNAKYDYYDANGVLYELKTRRCNKTRYETTLLPKHKIIEGKNQVFIFNFLDKISYIRYDKEVFDKFELQHLIDGRYNIERESVSHFLIPVSLLIDLD
jgi:hypothetical protein